MRYFATLLLVSLGLAFVSAAARLGARPQAHAESVASAWSGSRIDAKFFEGLQADYQKLDADVATVVTDDRPTRDASGRTIPGLRSRLIAVVGERLRGMDKVREEYLEQKRKERGLEPGTLLMFDGVSWTTTRG